MARPPWGRFLVLAALSALLALSMLAGWDGQLAGLRQYFADNFWFWLWGETASWLGQGGVQITPLALVTIWTFWRKRPEPAAAGLAALSAVVASGLVSQVMKHLVARPRPRLFGPFWEPFASVAQMDFNSFPSGHTITSFALAGALAAHFPRLAWLFYTLAGFVALGRVFSGSHHLSDCAGAAIAGLVMGWILGQASLGWQRAGRARAC